jgi:hypothetical protein
LALRILRLEIAWMINSFIKKSHISDIEGNQFLAIRDFVIEKCKEFIKSDMESFSLEVRHRII